MARAPFSTTCDIWAGYKTSPIAPLVSGVPCRFVPTSGILGLYFPFSNRVGYFTMDAVEPSGMAWTVVGSVISGDAGFANQIASPSLGLPQYVVLYIEEVTYLSEPTYFRVWVAELPFP